MKQVIIIGSIYPEGLLEEIKDKCTYVDYAADTFQKSLFIGLDKKADNISFITYPVYRASPFKFCFRGRRENTGFLCGKSKIIFTGLLNIPILKKIDETRRVYNELKNLLSKKNQSYVIVYSLHSPFLIPVILLRDKIRKTMVIIPDLPEYMGGGKGFLYKIAKTVDRFIINHCVARFDSFTLLSPYMKDHLPIKNKPAVVVEGIYSDLCLLDEDVVKSSGVNILYTGLISQRYGVFDLIEAFARINNNDYSLWLCGVCGCMEEKALLEDYLKKDRRIKYYGSVSSREARLLQRKASLLVNPRHSSGEFTKYSFPSKTMEYLASGTPTLMCKLPAIPEEYNDYLFYFEDESIDGYTSKIVEVASMDRSILKKRGLEGKQFIEMYKNEYVQASKISKLLLGVE